MKRDFMVVEDEEEYGQVIVSLAAMEVRLRKPMELAALIAATTLAACHASLPRQLRAHRRSAA